MLMSTFFFVGVILFQRTFSSIFRFSSWEIALYIFVLVDCVNMFITHGNTSQAQLALGVFVVSLAVKLLDQKSLKKIIRLLVIVISLFSIGNVILFFLIKSNFSLVDKCFAPYNEQVDFSSTHFLATCVHHIRHNIVFGYFARVKSFASEPSRLIPFFLMPSYLGLMLKDKTIKLLSVFIIICLLFPFSTNILALIAIGLGLLGISYLVRFEKNKNLFLIALAFIVMSCFVYGSSDSYSLSQFFRQSEINQDIQIFRGSTSRRVESIYDTLPSLSDPKFFGIKGMSTTNGTLISNLYARDGFIGYLAFSPVLFLITKETLLRLKYIRDSRRFGIILFYSIFISSFILPIFAYINSYQGLICMHIYMTIFSHPNSIDSNYRST